MPSANSLTALVDLDGNNLSVGTLALAANATGLLNVAIGPSALQSMSASSSNVGIGASALVLASGNSNTGVGREAMAATTSGSFCVAIGHGALGSNTTGSSNIAIGYNVSCDSATASNQVNIGNIYRHNRLVHTPATIAALNALTPVEGTRAICSDASTATFNATATGGGGNKVPVWYTGTEWKVG